MILHIALYLSYTYTVNEVYYFVKYQCLENADQQITRS